MEPLRPLETTSLPAGIRGRFVEGINGLRMHILEAGYESTGRPLVLLLHGFPELAYSWRKVMVPLAEAGFHVVAPDQRGYGRTTGWSGAYDQDLHPFSMMHLARDAMVLVRTLGHQSIPAVIGHDFGASVAAWCAVLRPDVFRSVTLMSAPFTGPPALRLPGAGRPSGLADPRLDEGLAALPRPRKHYQWYYATRQANADMMGAPEGLHAFLRAYFHHKSADWAENKPFRLKDWSGPQMAQMPTYYIMDRGDTMPEAVARHKPTAAEIAACRWLSEREMAVYTMEYARTGFQAALNWYRTRFDEAINDEMSMFAGRTIDIPSMFIAGEADWGIRQAPGAFEAMQEKACTRMIGAHVIPKAGHWVMQEQPEPVIRLLVDFCRANAA